MAAIEKLRAREAEIASQAQQIEALRAEIAQVQKIRTEPEESKDPAAAESSAQLLDEDAKFDYAVTLKINGITITSNSDKIKISVRELKNPLRRI